MLNKLAAAGIAAVCLLGSAAGAATIVADTVLDFSDSGTGNLAGPYGGVWSPAQFPVSVPLSYATDGNANTFVSLPRGSHLTLAFSTGYVIDGDGADLFIEEPGAGYEAAEVYVSGDWGVTFTLLGLAAGDTLTELDLATIGYTGKVNAVKVVGLDNGGASRGFDVAFVQGLDGSVVEEPQGPEAPVVPLPATLPMLLGAVGLIGVARRGR